MVGSRNTAARVVPGATCLSSFSHFPLRPYSKIVNPVALPPGRARLATKPAPTGVDHNREHDRHRARRRARFRASVRRAHRIRVAVLAARFARQRGTAGRLQQRRHGCGTSSCDDDVRPEGDQFGRVSAKAVGVGRGPANVDPDVATVGPTQLAQGLCERRDAGLCFRVIRGRGYEHADAPHALALLRTRRERPCRRAAEQGDELASSHCSL
jgi:hypothetical protein